jgi:MFS family permease
MVPGERELGVTVVASGADSGNISQEGFTDASGRPLARLATSALIRISLFWLGLTAIDGAVGASVASKIKFDGLAEPGGEGTALAIVGVLSFAFSVAVQPTVGAISDYTSTRWGRRKPYIFIGALLDAVFLLGIASSNTLLALAAFVTLLSFSTNVARGPFQGYVPDLVPAPQVGTASGLVGLMQVIGNIVGFGLAAFANASGNIGIALVAVAVVELITMLSVVLRVPNGPAAKPREGRSWVTVAKETWGTDILRETSYLWLLASRLLILMGGAAFVNFIVFYLADSHGLSQQEVGGAQFIFLAAVALASLVAIIPATRVSDRIGRKPVIYLASALGALSVVIIAAAPSIAVAAIGAAIFGASQGTFLAVDWALMTDIIPKASSGRYMGLSNVATASSTALAVAIGGVFIDIVNRSSLGVGAGERLELILAMAYFMIGALLLRPVVEPARPSPTPAAAPAT